MTQFKDKVRKQKMLLEAEKWGNTVQTYQYHNLPSMWYDTRPEDTENGNYVSDFQFNNGLIKRTLENGSIVWIGKKISGEKLINIYTQHQS